MMYDGDNDVVFDDGGMGEEEEKVKNRKILSWGWNIGCIEYIF